MSSRERVHRYFERAAARFDAIYEGDKPWTQRLVDRAFRQVVLERHRLIVNLAPVPGVWRVLDVGCGPGRYAVALARAGAAEVHGVDVAEAMIVLARAEAERAGVADRCRFTVSRFSDFDAPGPYEAIVATGYFDYLDDPVPDLAKMVGLARGRIFATFPKRWEVRVPIRRLRFALAGGFVRFYDRRQVEGLFASAGVSADRLSLIDLGRDWVAVARVP